MTPEIIGNPNDRGKQTNSQGAVGAKSVSMSKQGANYLRKLARFIFCEMAVWYLFQLSVTDIF